MRPTPPASYAGRHARPGAPGRRSRRRRFRRQIWLGALGVGFLLVAFSKDKRGLHDLIAGTAVGRR